jgi:hypothetical protein
VLSRALLTPGPLSPLSHFGLTLLRHAVGTGLRFALHQLGLPLPESPPVRIVRLRLYLDGEAIVGLLGAAAGGDEVAAALLYPGGAAGAPLPTALAAAAAFHRLRLRLVPRRLPGAEKVAAVPAWSAFREILSRGLPATSDALLAEILVALQRRARRRAGQVAPPCLSRAVARARRGSAVALDRFGAPDPRLASWAAAPAERETASAALGGGPFPPADSLRGRFRETYRRLLDRLRPSYLGLARRAVERGLVENVEDAFFLPFDVAEDLESNEPLRWLAPAVAANRREHEAALRAGEPDDLLRGDGEAVGPCGPRAEWASAPLLPLP